MRPHDTFVPFLSLGLVSTLACGAASRTPGPAESRPLPSRSSSPSASSDALPRADAIFERALDTLGGAQALGAVPGYRGRARFVSPAGLEGELIVLARAPDRIRMRLTLGPGWVFEGGANGAIAWTVDPVSGPQVRTGSSTRRTPDPFGPADFRARYPRRRTLGRATFADAPAWAVEVETIDGRSERHFFHRITGRPLGLKRRIEGRAVTATYSDWAPVGPLWMPRRIVNRTGDIEQEIVFESFELMSVPEDAFTPPPAVRAATSAARAPPRSSRDRPVRP